MNPGNGPKGFDPQEAPHYKCLQELRDASIPSRRAAFEALMAYDEAWYPSIRIMRVIVSEVLSGTGYGYDSIAYMNVLKWRTEKPSGLNQLYKLSMKAHTLDQIAALDPGIIVLLGVGVSDALHAIPDFQSLYSARCITIPRTNGDRYLKPEGHTAIAMARDKFIALMKAKSS